MVSEEQHMALPRLYGAPAYSRPARPAEVLARPFDPDELPLEAERTEADLALASELAGAHWAPSTQPPAKSKGRRRGRAAKAVGTQAAMQVGPQAAVPAAVGEAAAASQDGQPAGLQGRPFSLRGLGRIFSSDRK
jgi:hypothetical protein